MRVFEVFLKTLCLVKKYSFLSICILKGDNPIRLFPFHDKIDMYSVEAFPKAVSSLKTCHSVLICSHPNTLTQLSRRVAADTGDTSYRYKFSILRIIDPHFIQHPASIPQWYNRPIAALTDGGSAYLPTFVWASENRQTTDLRYDLMYCARSRIWIRICILY